MTFLKWVEEVNSLWHEMLIWCLTHSDDSKWSITLPWVMTMKPYEKIMQFIKKVFVVYKCWKFLSLQRYVCVFVCGCLWMHLGFDISANPVRDRVQGQGLESQSTQPRHQSVWHKCKHDANLATNPFLWSQTQPKAQKGQALSVSGSTFSSLLLPNEL